MADKISDVYNDDPNAGNDASKDFSTPVDFDEGTVEAYSKQQISNAVADSLGLTGNIANPGFFNITFPDNSLVAVIDPINTAYNYYVITTDSETVPTGGGTEGAIGLTAADWSPHDYRAYISADDSTYTKVTNLYDNGSGAVTVTARDTLSPTEVLTVSAGTTPSTDILVSGTVTDSATGVKQVDVLNFSDSTVLALDITSGPHAAGEIAVSKNIDVSSKYAPGEETSVYFRLTDNTAGGNELLTNDNPIGVTLGTTPSQGIISIKEIVTQAAEPGTDAVVRLQIEDRTQGIDVTCTISTLGSTDSSLLTAVPGTNFTAKSGAGTDHGSGGQLVTFPSGDESDIDVTIETLDNNETLSPQYQFQLNPGSQSGTAQIAAYPQNAVLLTITGDGAATGMPIQEGQRAFDPDLAAISSDLITYVAHGLVDDNEVYYAYQCLPGQTYNTLGPAEGTLYYVEKIDNDTFKLHTSAGAGGLVSLTKGGTGETHVIYTQDAGDQIILVSADNFDSTSIGESGGSWQLIADPLSDVTVSTQVLQPTQDTVVYTADALVAPKVHWNVEFTQTGPHNMEILSGVDPTDGDDANGDTLNALYDGAWWHDPTRFNVGQSDYDYAGLGGANPTFTVSATGQKILSCCQREKQNGICIEAVIAFEGGYSPDESEVLSRVPTGVASDNPLNLTSPLVPADAGVLNPTTLTPLDEEASASYTQNPFIYFAGATALEITDATVVDSGANAIGFTLKAPFIGNGIYGSGAYNTILMGSPFTFGETYTITMDGSVTNSSGVVETVAITAWNFTVQADQSGQPLFVNFENSPLGPYLEATLRDDFNVGDNSYGDSVHGPDYGTLDIVLDPTGGNHSKVLRCLFSAGSSGSGPTPPRGMRFRADWTATTAGTFSYDVFVPADFWGPTFEWPKQLKWPGLGSGTLLQMSHAFGGTPTVELLESFSYRMQSMLGPGNNYRGPAALGVYAYDKTDVTDMLWLDTATPPAQSNQTPYNIPKGEWINISQHMDVGTLNNADGVVQCSINGQLMLDENRMFLNDTLGFDNSSSLIDGAFMLVYTGGAGSDPENTAEKDEYIYFDNFTFVPDP